MRCHLHAPLAEGARSDPPAAEWTKPLIGDRCAYYAEFYGFGCGAQHLQEVYKGVKDLGCGGMVINEDGAFEMDNTWQALKLANEMFRA